MRVVHLCRLALAVGLAVFAGALQARAQDRPKIEFTPQVPHSDAIRAVAISPDGTRLLSGSYDKTLKLWDAATGRLIRTFYGHAGGVLSVAFSPDGMHLLWDAATGRQIRTFEGHAGWVTSVAFSPDGMRLLSGSLDKTLKLWDAGTGRQIRTFEGHADWVTSVAFSPDGTLVVSGSYDATIKIWDAATGRHMATLIGGRDGEWLAMTPSGFFAASEKGTEVLSVVRGLQSHSLKRFYDQLHRPDLVEELLKGDPQGRYKDAVRRLNLESILDLVPPR